MKRHQLLLLFCVPLLAASVHGSLNAYYKAATDCVSFLGISEFRFEQYNQLIFPPDRDTMCFVRCVGLVMDLWDDQSGTKWCSLASRLDPAVEQKTQACIQHKLTIIDPLDVCARAYFSLRCFRKHIQDVLADAPSPQALLPAQPASQCGCSGSSGSSGSSFIPKTATELFQAIATCTAQCGCPMLDLCNTADPLPDTPQTHCVVRCFGLQTGVYTDHDGVLINNLYAQLARCETMTSFRQRLEICFRRKQQPAGTAAAEVAYYQFGTCLFGDYARFFSSNFEELKLFPGLSQYCNLANLVS